MSMAMAEPSVDTADETLPSSSSSASASEEAPCADANFDEIKRDPSAEVLAKGIASIMGPVMNNFDAGVEGALKSQSVLASSIDRLTRELDKLLEDAPLPFVAQHATKLSGIRKRVLSLNTSLRIIQKRTDNIERLLVGYDDHGDDCVLHRLFSENHHTEDIKALENTQSGGSQNDHVQDESVFENQQDAINVPKPGGSQNVTRDAELGGLQTKGN